MNDDPPINMTEPVDVVSIGLDPKNKFNMNPLFASLVSGIPGLLGGGISALSQYVTNNINHKRQLDMYQENREYNSPKAQMERFREAGLNPNLIYGQSNTAQAMPVGNATAPNFDFLGSSAQSALNDFRLTDSNNVNRAIGYMTYGLSRINLAYLSEEKKVLYNQLLETLANLRIDGSLKGLQFNLNKINYEYDLEQKESGLPPDTEPRDRAILNLIGNILEFIGIIEDKAQWFNNLFK